MWIVNEYCKRQTRFRVVTLPKSGTYFLVDLLPRLGIKRKKISHVLNSGNGPALKPYQRAVMTIRDPRGFFVSLAHWCDIRCQHILEGQDPIAQYMNMKPDHVPSWLGYSWNEKLRYLITEDERSIFFEWLIRPHLDRASAYLREDRIKTVRFEDLMAWNGDAASDMQIETIRQMARFFGISLAPEAIADALVATRGTSLTFFRGKAKAWQDEISPENAALIEERWGNYITDWGYRQQSATPVAALPGSPRPTSDDRNPAWGPVASRCAASR